MDFIKNVLLIFLICLAGSFIADYKVPKKCQYIFGVIMGFLIMTVTMILNK